MRRHGRQFFHAVTLGASVGLALIAVGALLLAGSAGTAENSSVVSQASADSSTSQYLIHALTSDPQDLDEQAVRTAVDFIARCDGNGSASRPEATAVTTVRPASEGRQINTVHGQEPAPASPR